MTILRPYRLLLLLLLTIVFGGCQYITKTKTVRIGISPWPGYEPLVLGLEKNFYQDVDIRVIRFATPDESLKAFHDGMVDVIAITADEAMSYQAEHKNLKMFLVTDVSNGGDAIVVRPEIKSLDDLKNKRVASESSALGDYVIKRALDFSHNVRLDDLTLVSIETGEHEKAYRKGLADAFVTYEPAKTKLINAGGHILFDSSQIPNEIIDVLITDQKFLAEQKSSLHQITEGWFKTLHYIQSNPDSAMQRMAAYEGISKEEFKSAYSGLHVPSKQENKEMLNPKNGILIAPLKRIAENMHSKQTITSSVDAQKMLDDQLVR